MHAAAKNPLRLSVVGTTSASASVSGPAKTLAVALATVQAKHAMSTRIQIASSKLPLVTISTFVHCCKGGQGQSHLQPR